MREEGSRLKTIKVRITILFGTILLGATVCKAAEGCSVPTSAIDKAITPLMRAESLETVKAHPWILNTIQHTECCKTDWSQMGVLIPSKSSRPSKLQSPALKLNSKHSWAKSRQLIF